MAAERKGQQERLGLLFGRLTSYPLEDSSGASLQHHLPQTTASPPTAITSTLNLLLTAFTRPDIQHLSPQVRTHWLTHTCEGSEFDSPSFYVKTVSVCVLWPSTLFIFFYASGHFICLMLYLHFALWSTHTEIVRKRQLTQMESVLASCCESTSTVCESVENKNSLLICNKVYFSSGYR